MIAGRILQYQNQPTSADFPQVASVLSHCSKSFNSAGEMLHVALIKRVLTARVKDSYCKSVKSVYGGWTDALWKVSARVKVASRCFAPVFNTLKSELFVIKKNSFLL